MTVVVVREFGSISPSALFEFAGQIVGLAEFVGGSRAEPEIPWKPPFNSVPGTEAGSRSPAALPASAEEFVVVAEFRKVSIIAVNTLGVPARVGLRLGNWGRLAKTKHFLESGSCGVVLFCPAPGRMAGQVGCATAVSVHNVWRSAVCFRLLPGHVSTIFRNRWTFCLLIALFVLTLLR